MIPLQSQFALDPGQQSPVATIIMVVLLGGLLLAGIITAIFNNGGGSSGPRFSRWGFRRRARALGLERGHIKVLFTMIKRLKFPDPMHIVTNERRAGVFVHQSVQAVDASDARESVKEHDKGVLYEIRRRISTALQKAPRISSTKRLPQGQRVVVTTDGKLFYDTEITSRLETALGVECPVDSRGQDIRWKKGTKIGVKVLFGSNKVYTFVTRVLGYSQAGGMSTLLVQHSDAIQYRQKRRSPRIPFERAAYFYPVQVMQEGSGRRTKKKAVVLSSARTLGRIRDLSSGGCRMNSQRPLKSGTLLKIEFDTDAGPVAVFGKVRRAFATPPRGGDMHIMFTKVSQKHLNIIQSYVYDVSNE